MKSLLKVAKSVGLIQPLLKESDMDRLSLKMPIVCRPRQ